MNNETINKIIRKKVIWAEIEKIGEWMSEREHEALICFEEK